MQPALEQPQHLRGEAGGAATDFEDAQAAALRQMRHASLPGVMRSCPPPANISGQRRSESTSARVIFSTAAPISASVIP